MNFHHVTIHFFPLILLPCIGWTINRDDYLYKHMFLSYSSCFWFLFACHFLILYKIVVLRRKLSAENKSVYDLWDSDLEFENEIKIVPLQTVWCRRSPVCLVWQFIKNTYKFCFFRPVYGILLAVGAFFLGMCCYIRTHIEDWDNPEDMYLVSVELILPSLILIAVVLFIANFGFYDDPRNPRRIPSYRPFQETLEVPMTVMVTKALAVYMTSSFWNKILTFVLILFSSLSIFFFEYTYRVSAETVKKWQGRLNLKAPETHVRGLLAISAATGFCILLELARCAFEEASGRVLAIIEKNWRRNMLAIEYLLPDVEVETLEDLQTALDFKRAQQLTDGEIRAFNYLDRPLWKTKRAFVVQQAMPLELAMPDLLLDEQLVQQENEQPDPVREEAEAEEIERLAIVDVHQEDAEQVDEPVEQPAVDERQESREQSAREVPRQSARKRTKQARQQSATDEKVLSSDEDPVHFMKMDKRRKFAQGASSSGETAQPLPKPLTIHTRSKGPVGELQELPSTPRRSTKKQS